jgi:hypothetical protein
MSVEKRVAPYEVLFRFSQDTGAIIGAHEKKLETVLDTVTGEVYAVRELPPENILPQAYLDAAIGSVCTGLTLALSSANAALVNETAAKALVSEQSDISVRALTEAHLLEVAELNQTHRVALAEVTESRNLVVAENISLTARVSQLIADIEELESKINE